MSPKLTEDQYTALRWQQRFENYCNALRRLEHAIDAYKTTQDIDLIEMALIKAFEFTYELGWKTLKDYLKHQGIKLSLPREVIKQAFANNIIEHGQVWVDMLEDRNLMAHTYNEEKAHQAIENITTRYLVVLVELEQYLKSRKS